MDFEKFLDSDFTDQHDLLQTRIRFLTIALENFDSIAFHRALHSIFHYDEKLFIEGGFGPLPPHVIHAVQEHPLTLENTINLLSMSGLRLAIEPLVSPSD